MEMQSVASFESREEAAEAFRKLVAAGVIASVIESDGAFDIHVPEEFAYVAVQLIGDSAAGAGTTEANVPVACPECGAFETRVLPPYASMVFVLVVGLFVALYFFRQQALAFVLIVAVWPLFMWLSRFSGKRRCVQCGWRFSVN